MALFSAASLRAEVRYTILDFGVNSTQSRAINDSGQLAVAVGLNGAALYESYAGVNTMTTIGTLGGNTTVINGINNAGQMFGHSTLAGNAVTHGVMVTVTDGVVSMTDFGSNGGNYGSLLASNSDGLIVGTSNRNGGANPYEGQFFTDGSPSTRVGVGGTSRILYDVNDAGWAVGSTAPGSAATPRTATLYKIENGAITSTLSLGTLAGGANASSWASGINASGQIVGTSTFATGNSSTHATLFTVGPDDTVIRTDLGTLAGHDSSSAYSINDAGQIVGATNLNNTAFIYENGTLTELRTLVSAADRNTYSVVGMGGGGANMINNWGQIAATVRVNLIGHNRAVILNPVDPLTSTSQDGASRNTKFIDGMNYDKFTAITNPDGLGTEADLLGGTVGSGGRGEYGLNRDVDLTLSPNLGNAASDTALLSGAEGDTLALQLTYDEATAIALYGSEADILLGWLDGGVWKAAVDGNTGGTPTFVLGAWHVGYGLGMYGVDVENNKVWAVVNHEGTFAAISMVPEPQTWVLLAGASLLVLVVFRRRVN